MNLPYICGITFAPFVPAGRLSQDEARESLKTLKNNTNANFIILVPSGIQKNAQSEDIDFHSNRTITDDELKNTIAYAQELNLRVALKPTVNCENGTWRAHINFFDEDVPCEPKWSNWFSSYMNFQNHYAKISQEMGCDMHIAGCEMVMSERRSNEWREVIREIRKDYKGMVSYNTDKYQEHNVNWWDCVDVISSSGYYPIDDWENQLNRIEQVVNKYNKPFFFAETGCMSIAGSQNVPNDWSIRGKIDLSIQADWYKKAFEACNKRTWVKGFALWSWSDRLYSAQDASKNGNYDIYAKPAEKVVRDFYKIKSEEHYDY